MNTTLKYCSRHNYLKRCFLVIAVLLLGSNYASANSVTYDFYKLTNNNVEDLSGQLSITLWDAAMANSEFSLALGGDKVLFSVENDVGIASNIAEVYFDDGLLGPSTVENSLGGFTNFSGGGANPGDLPGGNTASPPFVATQTFSADASGNPVNGVNASGDILGIVLGLGSFADFDAVAAAVASGDLRFGLHVRSIGAAGGSDGYVNLNPVPVPAAVWLFGTALIGFIGISRRTKV